MTTKLKDKNLTSWDDHRDKKYEKKGSMTCEKYEEGFKNPQL